MNTSTINYDYIFPDVGYALDRQCDKDWKIEAATTNFIDLTYVYEGEAYYTINGVTYTVKKGDLLCIPKGSQRKAVTNPDCLMSAYPINFQLIDLEHNDIPLPFDLISHIGISESLIRLFQDLNLVWTEKKQGYILQSRILLTSIIHKLLCLLYYKESSKVFLDPRIRKAINYISQHYNQPITVNDLADLAGLNTAYFGILFKENTGLSVKKYINQFKINYAENLLLSGEFSITEVSQQCGFEDVFYFSKLFKSIKGYPPSHASNYI